MAYYDALIAKWAQAPAGTEQQKLVWINAQTVVGDPLPMIVQYYELYNRIDRAEYEARTNTQQASVTRIMQAGTVDYGPTSEARRQMATIFIPTSKTQQALKLYSDTFDKPNIPWATAPLSKQGGGLNGMVSHNDLVAAGIV